MDVFFWDRDRAAIEAASRLALFMNEALSAGKRVAWFVCGGSSIRIAVEAARQIRVPPGASVSILLTDERYGPVGHPDENYQQLIDAGFQLAGTSIVRVLRDESPDATAADYAQDVARAFESADIRVALFGIGADGHIAGILPHSSAVETKDLVCSYQSATYLRITLTPQALRQMDVAIAFAVGEEKRPTLERLVHQDVPLEEQPAQILKQISHAYLFTDQHTL